MPSSASPLATDLRISWSMMAVRGQTEGLFLLLEQIGLQHEQ